MHGSHADISLNPGIGGPTCPIEPTALMDESASSPFSSGGASNAYHNLHHPPDLSFLGQSSSSDNQAIRDFNAWNCSAQGCFPSQELQGPGQAGRPPRTIPDPPLTVPQKRKRSTSLEHAAAGSYGPIPGSSHEELNQQTSDKHPSPTIKFTERKNGAYDIWAFARALETDAAPERWPDDYGQHLNKRPDARFLGCKLCTEFG